MKIQKPKVNWNALLEKKQTAEELLTKGELEQIENRKWQGKEAVTLEKIEINQCYFQDGIYAESSWKQVSFVDCIFENCDLSNSDFSDSNFVRVQFKNCKLTGCNFSNTTFYHVSMQECIAPYANFAMAVWKTVEVNHCNFQSSSMQEMKLENIVLENTNLTLVQFFHTRLSGLNLTTCQIEGIVVEIADLKGAIVTEYQAMLLSKLLGIVIA